jgi:hypothetical protein
MNRLRVCSVSLILFSCANLAFPLPAEEIPGAYRFQTKSRVPDRPTPNIENILEIIPYKGDNIYFRMTLENELGRVCGLWGIARKKGDSFVFEYQSEYEKGKTFPVSIVLASDKITVAHDVNAADIYLNNYCPEAAFPRSSRRKITYMKKILNSRQYLEAVAAFQKNK